MEHRPWHPVLEGRARDAARAAADAIARALATPASGAAHPALMSGDAGEAVFLAYLARACPGEGWEQIALARLERAIEALATETLDPSLCDGFSGVAWAAAHAGALLGLDGAVDAHAEIDRALEKVLLRPPAALDAELLYGLSGLGVYYLERDPDPAARASLERIVARLEAAAVDTGHGLAWREAPWYRDPEEDDGAPAGKPRFNLGLAHGVPGVAAFLAHALARGVSPDHTRPLLQRATGFLLDQRRPAPAPAAFPSFVTPSLWPLEPARSAWCYGDPGVATALLAASRATARLDWEHQAIDVALRTARRPAGGSGVRDASLCHGAAGLGLVFARLHQETGEPLLRDAARRWFERTLELRMPDQGVAGYRAWMPEGKDDPWRDERGLLTGAAGIGLGLLAAATEVEPAWDAVLLLAPPAARGTAR